jgi:cell shape-determining protein MreC
MDAFQILVLILAAALALFLILGIILLILFIRISIKIKQVTETIGQAADNAVSFTDGLRRLASPAIVAKIVMKYVRNFANKRRGNNE